MKQIFQLIFIITFAISGLGCSAGQEDTPSPKDTAKATSKKSESTHTEKSKTTPLVTFIELGSVRCIPCQMMQPIMKSVEKKYGDQIAVVFYDVWRPEERHYALQYNIRVIPTQVFLDHAGKEIFRHEGYFPEPELDQFLQSTGLVVQNPSTGNEK